MGGDLIGPPILILLGLVVMAVFAVVAVRSGYTRTKMRTPAPTVIAVPTAPPEAPADPYRYGVRTGTKPVEPAARRTAIAWASQDLTGGTKVLRSLDGRVWEDVPREEWKS